MRIILHLKNDKHEHESRFLAHKWWKSLKLQTYWKLIIKIWPDLIYPFFCYRHWVTIYREQWTASCIVSLHPKCTTVLCNCYVTAAATPRRVVNVVWSDRVAGRTKVLRHIRMTMRRIKICWRNTDVEKIIKWQQRGLIIRTCVMHIPEEIQNTQGQFRMKNINLAKSYSRYSSLGVKQYKMAVCKDLGLRL